DSVDRAHDLVPATRLRCELLLTRRRQPVIPGAAVVFRCSPERRDPAAVLEAVQRWIERAMLHLEHILRSVRARIGNRMTMSRTEHERLQDQQVERPLEQFTLNRRIS